MVTYLIAGLGNPGRDYRTTRHNIGFMLLDRLAVKLGIRFSRLQSRALVAMVTQPPDRDGMEERRIVLAKPQTFMNLSGQSVQGLMHFYKLPLENLLIAHDDIDLPIGTIRIRPGGGAGGQKGMDSIIERFSTQNLARLRMGIGRPPGQMQASDYVLQDFSDAELKILSETFERATEAALTWVTEGLETAMNSFNGSVMI